MARASVANVRAVLPSSTQLTDAQIQASIDAATLLVDRIEANCKPTPNSDLLLQIEIYLSAHFAAATENTLSLASETDACSGSSAKYGFKFGPGVLGTPFGQLANTLSSGCLAEMDKRQPVLSVIGSISP